MFLLLFFPAFEFFELKQKKQKTEQPTTAKCKKKKSTE